jgi:hypothetical protein
MQIFVLVVLLLLTLVGSHDKTSAADNLPAQTIVVFNAAVPDAESLAKFYAEKRGIADDHLVELDCPAEEEISREQDDATTADPLRKISTSGNGGKSTRRPMEPNEFRRWRSISSLLSGVCRSRSDPLPRSITAIRRERPDP